MPHNVGQQNASRRALPARTLHWLDERPWKSRRDAHLFSIVLSMVNCGIPEEEAYGMLLDPFRPGGIALQERHQGNPFRARQWFHKQWVKAGQHVQDNPPMRDEHEVAAQICGLRDLADNHPELWSGVSGAYARSALDCVLHFATRAKTTNVRVSTRQAAEFMQCRQDTASKRLQQLSAEGVFFVRTVDSPCAVFRLRTVPEAQKRVSSPPSGGESTTDTLLQQLPDVFSRAGLGPQAWRIYKVLPPRPEPYAGTAKSPTGDVALPRTGEGKRKGPGEEQEQGGAIGIGQGVTYKWIASELGISTDTVRRHVRRLLESNLAVEHAGTFARGAADLTAVAQDLGVDGSRRARAVVHARQRDGYRRHLVERGAAVRQERDGDIRYFRADTGNLLWTGRAADLHREDAVG